MRCAQTLAHKLSAQITHFSSLRAVRVVAPSRFFQMLASSARPASETPDLFWDADVPILKQVHSLGRLLRLWLWRACPLKHVSGAHSVCARYRHFLVSRILQSSLVARPATAQVVYVVMNAGCKLHFGATVVCRALSSASKTATHSKNRPEHREDSV